MTRPKLYLIDGHSLAYRAFFALPPSMVTTSGQPTNALYGFARMLFTIIDDKKPAALVTTFDLPQPTFRHELYKEYKAHRPPSPEEFRSQIPLIKDFLDAAKIKRFEMPGYEADDLLGTIAKQAVQQGYAVVIVTGDRDALQLVTEHIHVLIPQKGLSESKEFDPAAVEAKYEGLHPEQLVDLKALMGDASDNIPGVAGVGEKTAIALVKEFGSIDNLLANLEKIPRQTVRQKVEQDLERLQQRYVLARINTAVPMHITVPDCAVNIAWEAVLPLLRRYELNSLVKKYEQTDTQVDLFSQAMPSDPQLVLQTRLMKFILNPERAIEDADISQNDIDSLAQYEERLRADGLYALYADIELPLADVLKEMTETGIKIDLAFLSKMSKELEGFIEGLERVIYIMAGEEFNLNSPKQLSEVLFDKLKMPVLKKTKTGYSTDAGVLEELAYEHDIARKLLEYRQLTKLKSTYVDALPLLVDPRTGRVHTTYHQTVTTTGRLSSTNPNLQNIPIRTELGKKIRQAFIPSKPEHMLLSADYSQIELRILAHMTAEPNLLEAFKNNLDVHRATAAKVFDVPLEAVTEQQRSQAKAVNFGIAYGMSARKLSRTVGLSLDEAQKFIDTYFQTYPGVKKYIDETIALAKQQGYVTTLLGRRRYFPEINSPKKQLAAMAERAAINMPMQGTSADFIKIAMIRIHDELHHQKMKSKMILQVHDELVFDGPAQEMYDLECLVKKIMCAVYPGLKVPLVVNVATGHTWLEAK